MNMRRAAIFLAGLCIMPSLALAQSGTIRGRVTDAAGAPLARASISAEGSGLSATSDDQGRYEIRGLDAGAYTLRVRMLGYQPKTARVVLDQGAVTQDFALTAQPISLSPVDVVVGSRARHTAAEQLAVPVDIFTSEDLTKQGSTETGQILQSLAPSINFPHQSVTDATDIVRPFTLRGLSPDQTLVLVNGWRRHQTALVNTFAYGMGAGSSGADLNAIPSSAIDRIDVLRDGAAAQYGSDAIAGVVNMVLKEGEITPFLNTSVGRYHPDDYPDDGTTVNLNGGWGIGVGRGSLGLFAEFLDRQPTNRAWADIYEDAGTGVADSIVDGQVIVKRNPVPQPNHHWGDGLEKDVMTMANFRLPLNDRGTTELYSFGGYSFRKGTGNGYRRCAVDCASLGGRSWQAAAGRADGGRQRREDDDPRTTAAGERGDRRRVPARGLSSLARRARVLYRRQPCRAGWRRRAAVFAGVPGIPSAGRVRHTPHERGCLRRSRNEPDAQVPHGPRGAVRELLRFRLTRHREARAQTSAIAAHPVSSGRQHRVPGSGARAVALQSRVDKRDRRRAHRRLHCARGRARGQAVRPQAAAGGDIGEPERRLGVQSQRQRHVHARRVPDQDQPSHPAERDVRRQRDAGAACRERVREHQRPSVLHQRHRHSDARDRSDRFAAHGSRSGHGRLDRRRELHEEQDPANRSAPGGARYDRRQYGDGDHRLGDVHRHHRRAAGLARYAHR